MTTINLNKIHYLKRSAVDKACHYLESKSFKGKAIIFGSSVTPICSEDSDIDVCLVTEGSIRNREFFEIYGGLSECLDNDCDILIYNRLSGKIIDEINMKGVTVYES